MQPTADPQSEQQMKHQLDKDLPHLAIEIVADGLTQDREQAGRICERMRVAWQRNSEFRKFFNHKDHRSVVIMWFKHWIEGENRRRKTSTAA